MGVRGPKPKDNPRYFHPLYQTYLGMKQRCLNPSHPRYKDYGGAGIKIYSRWLENFWNFVTDVEIEIGKRPLVETAGGRPYYTLDRYPDPYGNYEPGNIRWATQEEQIHNQRRKFRDRAAVARFLAKRKK
jgi:hypothetical protein